ASPPAPPFLRRTGTPAERCAPAAHPRRPSSCAASATTRICATRRAGPSSRRQRPTGCTASGTPARPVGPRCSEGPSPRDDSYRSPREDIDVLAGALVCCWSARSVSGSHLHGHSTVELAVAEHLSVLLL